jgi:hypothetical protein
MGRDDTAERTHHGLAASIPAPQVSLGASTHPQNPPGSTEAVAKSCRVGLTMTQLSNWQCMHL